MLASSAALRPVYSNTTQLNSTSSGVELSCVGEVSIATPTQLNSIRLTCFVLIGCTLFNWVSCIADRRRQFNCVGEGVYSDATQLNSTRRRVELSWVELRQRSFYSNPPTQLNSTRRRVELSCVAINGPLAVMRCPSVCLSVCLSVTFIHCVKTGNHIFKLFSPSGSQAILVFPYQMAWQYSDGNPLKGATNARGVWKMKIFDQYLALSPKWRKIEP